MRVTPLPKQFEEISSVPELGRFVAACLGLLRRRRDPVAAYMLAEALDKFGSIMSPGFFEQLGAIPDSSFYRGAAFNKFLELTRKQDAAAARWVAHYYLLGLTPVKRDKAQYLKWLKLSAKYGHPVSMAEIQHAKERRPSKAEATEV